MFLKKYVSLDLYDEDVKKIFIIDHKQLQFDKNDVLSLLVIFDKPDGSLSDHAMFCIHDDLFDRIKSTHQNTNIMWKFISDKPN